MFTVSMAPTGQFKSVRNFLIGQLYVILATTLPVPVCTGSLISNKTSIRWEILPKMVRVYGPTM